MKIKRALLVSALVLGGLFTFQESAFKIDADVVYENDIQESYDLNEKITLPDCLIYGEKTNLIVTFPDGTMTNNKTINLTMPGKYSVTYSNSEGNDTKVFRVYGKKYYGTNSSNIVEYRNNQKFQVGVEKTTDGVITNRTYDTAQGIFAQISDGAVFKYDVPIDISNCKAEDVILSLNVIATQDLSCDFAELYVRLTDAYDETNYVDFVMSHNGSQTNVTTDETQYYRAGAYNQVTSGFEEGKKNQMNVGKYGHYARCTFMNNAFNGNNLTDAFEVRMDYEKRIVYGPKKYYGNPHYVCDLDSPDDFGENLWNGFTTGECFVSIFARDYFTTTAQVFITKIGDLEGADFSENKILANESPVISIDCDGYEKKSLPNAVLNKPYTIFNATAHDFYSWCSDVKTNVYLDYQGNKINVSSKDNKFTPKIPGLYTIEYSAVNGFGNKKVETISVYCPVTTNPLTIDLSNYSTSAQTGTKVALGDYSVTNNQGKFEVTKKVTFNGEEVPITNNTFTPVNEGTYKVTFNAIDFAGQTAKNTYDVSVVTSNNPVFVNEPVFPRYFISGLKNKIPMFEAIDYKDGGKQIKTNIFVLEDGSGERIPLTSDVYIPTQKNCDYDATLVYSATGAFGAVEKQVDIKVRNIRVDGTTDNKFDTRKLFAMDNNFSSSFATIPGVIGSTSKYATYTTNSDGKISFVNPLPLNAFSLKFYVAQKHFKSLSFVLTDYETGKNHKISIRDAGSGSALLSIDNGIEYLVEDSDMTKTNKDFNLSYASNKIIFNLSNEFAIDGSAFASGKIYLDIMLEDVTSTSKITVQKICNHTLSEATKDNAEPIFSVSAYNGYASINSTLVIKSAQCLDMIEPYVEASLTVRRDGNVIGNLSNVDIGKEYIINLDGYGEYTLNYKATPALSSSTSARRTIKVIDNEVPVISLVNNINPAYNVGDTIKLNAKAVDNIDSNLKVYVVVQNAIGRNAGYSNGDSYTFPSAGNYKIKFYAYDNTGNYGYLTINVSVK